MTEATDKQFEELADRLTDPGRPLPAPAEVAGGAAAASAGRAMMLQEYGSGQALDAALRRPGRTRIGVTAKGASPMVRGRLAEVEFVAFKKLEEASGRTQSDLVREAIHKLLVEHKLVS